VGRSQPQIPFEPLPKPGLVRLQRRIVPAQETAEGQSLPSRSRHHSIRPPAPVLSGFPDRSTWVGSFPVLSGFPDRSTWVGSFPTWVGSLAMADAGVTAASSHHRAGSLPFRAASAAASANLGGVGGVGARQRGWESSTDQSRSAVNNK
jgi:hypothetical protein